MSSEKWDDSLDDRLRALTVHDVAAVRAERTRQACLAGLKARQASAAAPGTAAAPRRSPWDWAEPAAAIVVCAVYLAAAIRVSTVLLGT
jgi:hypothetical protein